MNTSLDTIRLTITIPQSVVNDVKQATSPRGISSFIVEAVKTELARKKKQAALKRLANLPPAAPDITDPIAFVNKLREEAEERLIRENL